MTAHGATQNSFSLYKGYDVPISENYVVFFARAMLPDKYVVLDLTQNEVRIYSAYRSEGLLHTYHLTNDEYTWVTVLLSSDQVQMIPPSSGKVAMDAFEFSAQGIIEGKPFKFDHIMPENKEVLSLYKLYMFYRDKAPKKK